MDILSQIVAHKRTEVARRKELISLILLEKSELFETKTASMIKHIRGADQVGIIAEFKRQSPSKGKINTTATVEKTSTGYVQGGASGLSILTDEKYFGGTISDLLEARELNSCPILQKDFIIDEYQIVEAKSIGADTILLIAAILSKTEVTSFANMAKELEMEVLLEVHNENELEKLCPQIDLVGVNNRNLKTFETSTEISKELAPEIPAGFLKISESGIHNADTVLELKDHGFEGFLVGERFMASSSPEKACREFIESIESKLDTHAA